MNNIEADICLKCQLPVRIINPKEPYQKVKSYKITELHKFKDRWVNHEYIMSAGLSPENNQRTSFTQNINDLEVLPEFKNFLAKKYEQQRKKIIKSLVKELLDDGENKTTLGKKLKNLVDEIRNKQPVSP